MRINNIFIRAAAVIAVIISGCGYTTASIVIAGAKTIFVSNFANKINLTEETTDKRMYIGYRSGMEITVTREIINRFITDGNLRITDIRKADLVLEGSLVDFKKEALRYDAEDNILEYRVKVIIDFKITDAKTNSVIVDEKGFTGESSYRTSGPLVKSEDRAIQDATKDLAQRVVERVVQSW